MNVKENWKEIMTAPIPKNEMEWIIKTKSEGKKGVKALMVTHTTRQLGIARLNEAFGLAWSDSYEDKTLIHEKEYGNKEFVEVKYTECTIKVQNENGIFVTERKGRASSADIEPEKSAESNAFKRAVQKFGFGLELYNYPKVYVECTGSGTGTKNKYPPARAVIQKALDYVHEQANSGTALAEYFIDSKGNLYSFAYGWSDKPVSIGISLKKSTKPAKKDFVETGTKVESPKLGTFPPYSDKPNSSWNKAIAKWDGKIHTAKTGEYNYVVLDSFGKKSYHKVTKGVEDLLRAHSKFVK